ncbi:hypothetical protein F4809DRAFT_593084 [Biscogniauxia mediterranea]|nr:hypothetical protein F4809DRAFT_593084 [Biscogniauxia mediterranea]
MCSQTLPSFFIVRIEYNKKLFIPYSLIFSCIFLLFSPFHVHSFFFPPLPKLPQAPGSLLSTNTSSLSFTIIAIINTLSTIFFAICNRHSIPVLAILSHINLLKALNTYPAGKSTKITTCLLRYGKIHLPASR